MEESKLRESTFKGLVANREKIEKNISGIKNKIAIYSGKGGVGKTTIALNIAGALISRGFKVGVFDADIDCPNVCELMGIKERLKIEDVIKPLEKYGIKVISTGALENPEQKASIWRGPVLTLFVAKLMGMAEWGDLDYLIIDMPPGTSDVPLTIMQLIPLDGFIIVTTPQKVSVLDAIKSGNMIKEMKIKILGVIENMSGDVFGIGGGEDVSKKISVPFLGYVDINKKIREYSDQGKIASIEDEEIRKSFDKIINNII